MQSTPMNAQQPRGLLSYRAKMPFTWFPEKEVVGVPTKERGREERVGRVLPKPPDELESRYCNVF